MSGNLDNSGFFEKLIVSGHIPSRPPRPPAIVQVSCEYCGNNKRMNKKCSSCGANTNG